MRYASLFSGIGGLEHPTIRPELFCEKDEAARVVLSALHPGVSIRTDVEQLEPVQVDCVAGGWPCQDLTVAGRMKGIRADRSGLFFDMVHYAERCGAATVVGENVPNLLRIRKGEDFRVVLRTLEEAGFGWISWRTLDAREFGLPQSRRRVIIVASKKREVALALHREIEFRNRSCGKRLQQNAAQKTYGFYWTGGLGRSLCLAEGVVPPLKVGSSTSKGTSPVAVFMDGAVRKLSASAGLRLQGFETVDAFRQHIEGDVFRMAGNAVPRPMGQFALGSVTWEQPVEVVRTCCNGIPASGWYENCEMSRVEHQVTYTYPQLSSFINDECRVLSPQASAGLLTRVIRASRQVPVELFDALYLRSGTRTRLIGTKINSFDVLDKELDATAYREGLLANLDSPDLFTLTAL